MVDSFVLILIVDSEIQFPPIQTSFGKQISKLINSVCDRDSVLFYLFRSLPAGVVGNKNTLQSLSSLVSKKKIKFIRHQCDSSEMQRQYDKMKYSLRH